MKKSALLFIGLVVLVFACSKQKTPGPLYSADSTEYSFFQKLAVKAPILNPDVVNELITSKEFTVYTNDVMPIVYRQWFRFASNLDQIPPDQISGFLAYAANQEGERRLMVSAAQKAKITVTDDSVDVELQKIYASAGGEEKFVQSIAKQGITLDFVKEDLRKSVYARKYLDAEVWGKIEVSDEDLQKAYLEDKTATVRHILLSTRGKSEDEKAEVRTKIEGLLEQVRNGEDFAELAKTYTEDPGSKANGGLYENFGRGKMVKSFEDAAFNVPIGSLSDVVETEYGFHILKVESRSKETRPLEEVETELRTNLQNIKKNSVYKDALDELKKKYNYQEVHTN